MMRALMLSVVAASFVTFEAIHAMLLLRLRHVDAASLPAVARGRLAIDTALLLRYC